MKTIERSGSKTAALAAELLANLKQAGDGYAMWIDGKWSADDHHRRTVSRGFDRLLDGETAHGLHGNRNSIHDVAQSR